jgi:anti-sigma B factor antagonist
MAMPQELVTFLEYGDVCMLFDADETLIRLAGEVDLAIAESLDFVAEEATKRDRPVRVDVSRVTFIDSTGLAFLGRLAAAGHAAGCAPQVIGASQRVRETIEIGGLTPVLDLRAR